MRQSIVGNVIAIIVLFMSLFILPAYYIGVIDWRSDMNICQTAARNFVDSVIDTGVVSEKALTDLNLSIASTTSNFTYTYIKEEKIINPDINNPGKYEVTYIKMDADENTTWRSGDIVTIVITQQNYNMFQRLSNAFLGATYNISEIRLAGMVR